MHALLTALVAKVAKFMSDTKQKSSWTAVVTVVIVLLVQTGGLFYWGGTIAANQSENTRWHEQTQKLLDRLTTTVDNNRVAVTEGKEGRRHMLELIAAVNNRIEMSERRLERMENSVINGSNKP